MQTDETLDVALEKLTSHRVGWMPVIDTDIEPGDTVTFLVSPASEALLRKYLEEGVEQKEAVLLD